MNWIICMFLIIVAVTKTMHDTIHHTACIRNIRASPGVKWLCYSFWWRLFISTQSSLLPYKKKTGENHPPAFLQLHVTMWPRLHWWRGNAKWVRNVFFSLLTFQTPVFCVLFSLPTLWFSSVPTVQSEGIVGLENSLKPETDQVMGQKNHWSLDDPGEESTHQTGPSMRKDTHEVKTIVIVFRAWTCLL